MDTLGMEAAHLLAATDVLRGFAVAAEEGLSPAQVAAARERHGPNGESRRGAGSCLSFPVAPAGGRASRAALGPLRPGEARAIGVRAPRVGASRPATHLLPATCMQVPGRGLQARPPAGPNAPQRTPQRSAPKVPLGIGFPGAPTPRSSSFCTPGGCGRQLAGGAGDPPPRGSEAGCGPRPLEEFPGEMGRPGAQLPDARQAPGRD